DAHQLPRTGLLIFAQAAADVPSCRLPQVGGFPAHRPRQVATKRHGRGEAQARSDVRENREEPSAQGIAQTMSFLPRRSYDSMGDKEVTHGGKSIQPA